MKVRRLLRGHLCTQALWLLLLYLQTILGADKLRLVNGSSPCAGRVEIKYHDEWGTVCDNEWDLLDAKIVCKELGCGSASTHHNNAYFGAGSGKTWLDNSDCIGTESALSECSHSRWGENNCSHNKDAGVTCSASTSHQPSAELVFVFFCICLGALLCLVLIIFGVLVQRIRVQHRGSRKSQDPFSEDAYEQFFYKSRTKKLKVFGHSSSVSYSEDAVIKLQYYTRDGKEGSGPGSTQDSPSLSQDSYDDAGEVSPMHGGGTTEVPEEPGDDYDDAFEVSDVSDDYDDVKAVWGPEDLISGQNDWEDTGTEEDSDRKRESQTGWSSHSLRSEEDSGAEKEEPPMPPGDTDYVVLEDDNSGIQL